MKTAIVVLIALAAAVPAYAQSEQQPSQIIDMTVTWQQWLGSIVAILVGGGLIYTVIERVAKLVDPSLVEKAADSFERGFKAGQEKAKQTPQLSDDLFFHIAEPVVAAILAALRAQGHNVDPQLIKEELARQRSDRQTG